MPSAPFDEPSPALTPRGPSGGGPKNACLPRPPALRLMLAIEAGSNVEWAGNDAGVEGNEDGAAATGGDDCR